MPHLANRMWVSRSGVGWRGVGSLTGPTARPKLSSRPTEELPAHNQEPRGVEQTAHDKNRSGITADHPDGYKNPRQNCVGCHVLPSDSHPYHCDEGDVSTKRPATIKTKTSNFPIRRSPSTFQHFNQSKSHNWRTDSRLTALRVSDCRVCDRRCEEQAQRCITRVKLDEHH